MPHPYLAATASPRVLAHRGLVTAELAREGVVENSYAAVEAAQESGARYVESDCHLTSDGTVVLFHDDDLGRLTGDPRPVAEVQLRELAALMDSRGGLLTLAQALDAFPELCFNIDVKADSAAAQAGSIIAPHAERVLITSFSDVRRRRAFAASVARGGRPATAPGRTGVAHLLFAATAGSCRLVHRSLAGIDAVQIPERAGALRVLTPAVLSAAQSMGVEVHVWTVNDPQRMRELVRMGVDGIVTDRADLALTL